MLVSRVSTDDRPSANRNGAGKPGGRACPSGDSSEEQPTKQTILNTLNNIFSLEFYIFTSLCFNLTVFFWILFHLVKFIIFNLPFLLILKRKLGVFIL